METHSNFETLMSDSYFSKDFDGDKVLIKENTSTSLSHYRSPGLCIKDSENHVLCILGPRLEPTGFSQEHFKRFVIIRPPAYTLGGTGGGIAYTREAFETILKSGLDASSTSQVVLVEKSLLGWKKEYEREVMRDLADNAVIIENIDPMGVHTEDSITVAPAQTLTDKEYQRRLRDYSIAIIREIGVECGGSNVQFAVNLVDGEVMVIEMNPRVSRSSALASKATGFPIAKMAAKLSVGYTLDQFPNDITPASFEPSIDYVVPKDTWKEVDPDEMSYEELLALGEAVGTQSRGLSSDTIATLPSISYKAQDNQDGNDDPCVICRLEYEEGGTLTVLSCKHSYHSECINNWLQINKEAGFETIMMNSNPETVSTDYDTSDRLYFEPLTVEDVLDIIDLERPDGIVVQFGGQTPLKLALPIEQYLNEHKLLAASGAGYVRILGTSPDSINAAEDRERFNAILNELKIGQPKGGIAKSGADVEGGSLIRTDESKINGGDFHFAEIIYTNGPKGMRVFNDFLQGEKVLAELDIYSVVGANKPLQLLDARVFVGEDGEIASSFEGVHDSPVVSWICIRRAPKPPDPLIEPEYLTCNNCATEIPLAQGKIKTMKREQSHIGFLPAGGLIDLHSMSKKKRKIEQKQVPIYVYFLVIYLASFPPQGAPSFPPQGAPSFAAMVGSNASTRNSVGPPSGKKTGNSLTGGGNKSQLSLQSLKLKFNLKKPTLEFMVIAYQWVHGCFLARICNLIPQDWSDWMLHGLWPPSDADQWCYDDFDEEKIRRNPDFLEDLLRNWASLKCDSGDKEGHIRFWKRQWLKHGVKSRLSQKLYMKLALHLHDRYKRVLTDAMNAVKTSVASFDSALGTDVFTVNTSAFEFAVSTRLAVPKIKWIEVGKNKYVLKEVQLKISLLSDDYQVHDMDNRGETLPLELIV